MNNQAPASFRSLAEDGDPTLMSGQDHGSLHQGFGRA
jgi:hypothetical protein